MVRIIAFHSHDPSSNAAKDYSFWQSQNKQKVARVSPFQKGCLQWIEKESLLVTAFLKNGPIPASFFWSFQTNNTIFTANQCQKMSISIRRRDLNP